MAFNSHGSGGVRQTTNRARGTDEMIMLLLLAIGATIAVGGILSAES